MLRPARTDLPRIDNVYPDGSILLQRTNTLSFTASSPTYGINATNIQVILNGANISSNLVLSGSSTSWNVTYPGLQPSTVYTAVISLTDSNHQTAAITLTFDTLFPIAKAGMRGVIGMICYSFQCHIGVRKPRCLTI